MRNSILALLVILLSACQSAPRLEDDTRYAKLATVVHKHEFSDVERKQAQANSPGDSNISFGIGVGVSTGSFSGGFGSMMMGMGGPADRSDELPRISKGAIRYTVQLPGTEERIEVMSYAQYKVGDCVKVLAGHPSEFPRFFKLKPNEHCK